jgi:succinate-semialdehyde dehydrogenase/glutarate-semialdehyde dehydrogenase
MKSVNPAEGITIQSYSPHSPAEVDRAITKAQAAFKQWREKGFAERIALLKRVAILLRARKATLAQLMAEEMGKVIKEGEQEIEKCATACDFYADHGPAMLADEPLVSEARSSFITYQPLGVILAVMPWNFPFWQVFRFAAPNLMAGNVGLLKHASNVCGCALAIETLFRDAGFPEGCFTTLLISSHDVERVIRHPTVVAVTLTGSAGAGRSVAAIAGSVLKKTVLELGGSDAYVVLADADIAKAAEECAKSRLLNAGQSCIAAKRFIVLSSVYKEFEKHFIHYFSNVRMGEPTDPHAQIGPLARVDLRDALHEQVERSIKRGAKLALGGKVPEGLGAFYPPTVLTNVNPGMPAFDEEMFGPVASLIEARDEDDAFSLANATSFGLGSALFTSDLKRGKELARTKLDAGQAFVNTLVRSDPRLPFGGIKESGYGRELGLYGLREFVNAKTVYIA